MQKLISFDNMELKLIEYKPLIFRLYKAIDSWNKDFENKIDLNNWYRKECIDCNYQDCLPCPLDD